MGLLRLQQTDISLKSSQIHVEVAVSAQYQNGPVQQSELLERASKPFLTADQHEERGWLHDAFVCLREAAELGHASNQLNLGHFYSVWRSTDEDVHVLGGSWIPVNSDCIGRYKKKPNFFL